MIKLTKNEVVNAIAKSDGIGELAFRDYRGSTVRVPVKMSDVTITGNYYDSGSDYTVTCDILGTNPLKADFGVDVARMYLTTTPNDNLKKLAYEYLKHDVVTVKKLNEMMKTNPYIPSLPEIKNVVHNSSPKNGSIPATIVFWMDGTKTVVKAVNEEYDPEKGIAMAFMKKMFGNKGNYFNNIKKWLPKQTEAKAEQASDVVPRSEYELLLNDFELALHYAGKNNNVCNFCEHDCGEGGACKGRNDFIHCNPKWRGVVKSSADKAEQASEKTEEDK